MIMHHKTIRFFFLFFLIVYSAFSACAEDTFEVKRIGNIHPYEDNAFMVLSPEDGELTISVSDDICVYRSFTEHITAGENTVHWDGCGYNQERLTEKTYTINARLETISGKEYIQSFLSPVEYAGQYLQYALPSSDKLYLDACEAWFLETRTVQNGMIVVELKPLTKETETSVYSFATVGGKINRNSFASIMGKKNTPPGGEYTVTVYEKGNSRNCYEFSLSVEEHIPGKIPVYITEEIMPDRDMSEEEIWNMMMRPSIVIDIDYFDHLQILEEPDASGKTLGTLHGQTQGLKVMEISDQWARIGAWNHEDAEYTEGWVPVDKLKVEYPNEKYGILVDKKYQTLTLFQEGKIIDQILVSTGRAEVNNLFRETSAGAFLTGFHRVNFSMNGKKYDYVIQYDGGNLIHQTPYAWGQQKKDFTLGRGYLGAKASHACIRVQPEPGKGGINAYWLFTHIPYHTRVMILDDPDERIPVTEKLSRGKKAVPEYDAFRNDPMPAFDDDRSVAITLAGSFIPGGTKVFNAKKDSFVSYARQAGYEAPLSGIQEWLNTDDLSCVTLSCKIEDKNESSTEIQGEVYAPADMAEVFRRSSIEFLYTPEADANDSSIPDRTNNSSSCSFAETLSGTEVNVLKIKGHQIGFAQCSENEYLQKPDTIDERIQELKEKQCEAVIMFLKWNESNDQEHSIVHEAMAHRCVKAGADLVAGNQKSIVRGIDYYDNVPVIYSLGTLLDGSKLNKTKKQQGILVRALLSFSGSEPSVSVSLIPVSSGEEAGNPENAYCVSSDLKTSVYQSVLKSIWKDSTDTAIQRTCFPNPQK